MYKKNGWAFLLMCSVLIFYSCSKHKEGIKPTFSEITESVYAAGYIKASGQYKVFSQVNGILQEVKFKPGDYVRKGETLFVLDKNTAGLNTQNSRLSLELSESFSRDASEKLQEAKLRTRLAYNKFQVDSSLYMRQKHLWDQKIGSQLDFDERRLAFISSKNDYEITKREYGQLKLSLKNELEKARVNYAASKKIEDNFNVRSAISGRIFDILVEKGDLISTQTQLAVIGQAKQFLLELQVDENDISQIKPGQTVVITMDSYQGQVFEGIVTRIYPIMNEQSRTFQVDATFLQAPPNLYPNLTAEANIIIRRKKKAIVIPRAYIDDNNNVWLSKDKKRKVRTGLRDTKKIEIAAGLDTSDVIYMPQK